jgi:hypothetical protein
VSGLACVGSYRPSSTPPGSLIAVNSPHASSRTGQANSTPLRDSVGSKQIKSNAVTSSKVKDGSLLGKDFKAGQLPTGPKGDPGSTGPRGPQGLKGDKGDKGDSGTPAVRLWAVFQADGSISSQEGVVSSAHPSTGVTDVTFNRDVTGCAAVVSAIGPGAITAVWNVAGASTVRITTMAGAMAINRNVSIIVACPSA